MPGPTIEDMLAATWGGGTDPVVNTELPHVPGVSSSANQARGPWIRKAMEQYPQGKELADFFAGLMQHWSAMPLGSKTGRAAAHTPDWLHAAEQKALHDPGFYDRGITGGSPTTWPDGLTTPSVSGSADLAARAGTSTLKPNWPDPAIGRIWAERPDMVNIEAGNNNTHASGPFTPEPWSPGMTTPKEVQGNMRVSPDRIGGEPANNNPAPPPTTAEILARYLAKHYEDGIAPGLPGENSGIHAKEMLPTRLGKKYENTNEPE